MNRKKTYSNFNAKIWYIKSKVVKQKAFEINQKIENVINKYNENTTSNLVDLDEDDEFLN